ncbi:uncharacterized protein SCHCODRAFT_02644700 [Schizophyllum commune H4-8]|nr:uncharacterized protein SCHCODRAFT_02644700 [Schizophyllum commune H4-8]KAI5885421.1 hypothetical protein SCHCODRAFT_02644700 [Schizophyllum commune H4-8]
MPFRKGHSAQPAASVMPAMEGPRTLESEKAAAAGEVFDAVLKSAEKAMRSEAEEPPLQRKVNAYEDRALKNVPLETITASGDNSDVEEMVSYVEGQVSHLAENCTLLLKALDTISEIHPFVKGAVMAFKALISLEAKRLENNRKVLTLRIQMKDMMAALQQLQHIGADHTDNEGNTISGRLKPVMTAIARDIIACAHECDTYAKKRLLAKVFKSPIYEQRFVEFGERFARHHQSINVAIEVHTTITVTEVKGMLAFNTEVLMKVFRRLDTPREREIRREIEKNGGPEKCADNDVVLEQLVRIGGATMGADKPHSRDRSEMLYLKKELQEDLDETLGKGLDRFLEKLRSLKDEVTGALEEVQKSIQRQGDRVVYDLSKGPHERVNNQEIHDLWKEMHWRNSVKAHHFTLALRDHLIEKFYEKHGGEHVHNAGIEPTQETQETQQASLPQSPAQEMQSESPEDMAHVFAEQPQAQDNDDDNGEEWAIKALTVLTAQPIAETLDDDGTGFISTWEVNFFTSSRPEDWSLLHWLVYWGEGWYASLREYREKILHTMKKMYNALDGLHHVNRSAVDMYLDHYAFRRVELLMRGLDTSRRCADERILRRLSEYTDREEERLTQALKGIKYEIDDAFTLQRLLVKGRGRIERYIFPLLHLMLRHHLKLIRRGKNFLVDEPELIRASNSLLQLMKAVDERVLRLKAAMRHPRTDGHARLTTYAFGMLQHIVNSGFTDPRPEDNLLRSDDSGSSYDEEEDSEGDDSYSEAGSGSDGADATSEAETADDEKGPTETGMLATAGADSPKDSDADVTSLEEADADSPEEATDCHKEDLGHSDFGGRKRQPNVRLSSEYDVSGYDIVPSPPSTVDSPLSGAWTSEPASYYLGMQLGVFSGILAIFIGLGEDGAISGVGRCAPYDCSISGAQKMEDSGITTFSLTIDFQARAWVPSTASFSLTLEGRYDDSSKSIVCSEGAGFEWTFVRTPADVYASRHYIAKERSYRGLWNFAIAAVQSRIRRQRPIQRLKQMLHYVNPPTQQRPDGSDTHAADDSTKAKESASTATPKEDERGGAIEDTRALLSPEDARLYHSMVAFRRGQLRLHYNAWCNACDNMIVGDRYACLQCTEDGLSNQIDLCADCRDQTPTYHALVHSPAHTMVRIRFHLHNKDKKLVYDNARKALERVKYCIGSQLDAAATPNRDQSAAQTKAGCMIPECVQCGKEGSLPCYYCSGCCVASMGKEDVFGCKDCLDKGYLDRIHTCAPDYRYHFWILVREEAIRPVFTSMELQLKSLQKKFEDLSTRMAKLELFNDRMEALDQKLDKVLAARE